MQKYAECQHQQIHEHHKSIVELRSQPTPTTRGAQLRNPAPCQLTTSLTTHDRCQSLCGFPNPHEPHQLPLPLLQPCPWPNADVDRCQNPTETHGSHPQHEHRQNQATTGPR
jgi:hypothetical protein